MIDTLSLPVVKFHWNCLIRSNIYAFRKVLKLYISYTLNKWLGDLNTGFKLDNCSFGFVKLTENTDLDKYPYSVYDIGFSTRLQFSLPGIISELMIALLCIWWYTWVIWGLGEGPAQGLDDYTIAAKGQYPINFSEPGIRFVLTLCYNGINNFLFINATNYINSKQKIQKFKHIHSIMSR